MSILGILLPLHSLLRWALLLLLIVVIIKSAIGMNTKQEFAPSDNRLSLMLMSTAHIQLIIGLILFFISPAVNISHPLANDETRFFTIEHSVMMLIAIALITLARISSKKALEPVKKFKRLFYYNLIALLVILAGIPWPFGHVSRGWF